MDNKTYTLEIQLQSIECLFNIKLNKINKI